MLVRSLTLAAAALASVALAPRPAAACGGFFCSQIPVDQSGEQILFGMGNDGTIEAHIMISYSGEASDFAWLLPVASTPEIALGTQAAFTTVGYLTQPTWYLDWQNQANQCNWWYLQPTFEDDEATGGGAPGGVTVVAQKDVGPFETVVLDSGSTDALVKWLDDHDYAQPPAARPLLDHYVRQGMEFVAVRLKKDEPTGAIQPIVLKFREANPCVPLVLTQIAATPDMPVQLFLFGEHRVVPTNWLHVVVNEKKIDWINNGANYKDLVTQAVDEAAGHGFVTEYAGSAALTADSVYREGRFDLAKLSAIHDPAAFVAELLSQGFPRDAAMQSLLRTHIPMPQAVKDRGVSEQQFYNDLASYAADLAAAGFVFDAQAFVDDLEERVVVPLQRAQALFDGHPYLTRLFTTVSSDEMDRDPVFAANADLADVSNQHRATADAVCKDDGDQMPDEVQITLESGETFVVTGPFQQTYPVTYPDPAPDEPAAARIELIGKAGQGTVVAATLAEAVDTALDTQTPESVLADLADGTLSPPVIPPVQTKADSSGCQGGPEDAAPGVLASLALAFVILRRVRRGSALSA
ncbi:MAG: DUF2330 domain-containing protein [Myxococcota bacterium]